jgi:hypothetical protein
VRITFLAAREIRRGRHFPPHVGDKCAREAVLK